MIVFGSRGSDLALTQTRMVAAALARAAGCQYRIEIIETRGDRVVDRPLPEIGGKGLFTQELEDALRQGRIDVAVHSLKDLPVADPAGLTIGAVPERRDPGDVLVCQPQWFDRNGTVPLRSGCRVGTSSHRRRAALERLRPDLVFADVRGNVPTRVDKVRRGDYGAVVLAAAGLDRLQLPLGELVRAALPIEQFPPAPAQGALGVQCRSGDTRVLAMLAQLHDAVADRCARAERDVLFKLGGGCSMPLGVLVTDERDGFRLRAAFYSLPQPGHTPAGVFVDLRGRDPLALAEQVAARWRPLVDTPLAGRDVVLLRPDDGSRDLDDALAVAGARVRRIALTRVVPIAGVAVDAATVQDRMLAFTSARAVELFCAAARVDLRGRSAFAGGPATAAAVHAHGMTPIAATLGSGGRALAERIRTSPPPAGILFPCAEERHPDLEDGLRAAQIAVVPLPVYRTEQLPPNAVDVPAGATVVFASPSAVRAWAAAPRPRARHVAIGQSTAAAMRDAGVPCDAVADEPTAAGLIRSLEVVSQCPAPPRSTGPGPL